MNREPRVASEVRAAVIILLTGLVIAGCVGSSREKAAVPSPARSTAPVVRAAVVSALADTQWRLVEFQSMDDSVGIQRTNDPTRYTMRLNGDGTVALRLNCNSAHGTWIAGASSDDSSSGRFEFSPLAATSALCPPPSLDAQILSQAKYIRSYLLKDSRLYLSLMADGGIYVWEPHAEEPFQTKPDPDIEAAILKSSPYYTRYVVDKEGGVGRGRYVYGRVDLNGDGRDEVFVYLLGSIFCGTGGCNLQLYTHGPNGYALVSNFPTSRLPVIVSALKTEWWNDLWRLESGGGIKASYARHSFDGNQYAERERVPADKVPQGKSYLAGEVTFDKGIPLAPGT